MRPYQPRLDANPYVLTVAAVSFVNYIIAGFVQNVFVCLLTGAALMFAVLLLVRRFAPKGEAAA